MTGLYVIVCGGRDYSDQDAVNRALNGLHLTYGISMVITGGARGADKIAKKWAEAYNVLNKEVRAEWDKYRDAAGPIRNRRMLEENSPDLVVAFPGGPGTANMVKQARQRGVRVMEVSE